MHGGSNRGVSLGYEILHFGSFNRVHAESVLHWVHVQVMKGFSHWSASKFNIEPNGEFVDVCAKKDRASPNMKKTPSMCFLCRF